MTLNQSQRCKTRTRSLDEKRHPNINGEKPERFNPLQSLHQAKVDQKLCLGPTVWSDYISSSISS